LRKILAILAVFLGLVLATSTALAQETTLPSPGITPNSPLYFLDTWGEDISVALARSPQERARKQHAIAQEKLAETQMMAEQGNRDATEIAAERYVKMVSGAAQNLAEAARTGEGFDEALAELIATATSIAQSVLAGVYDKVPEEAKGAIERAMVNAGQGTEAALGALSGERLERVRTQTQERLEEAREQAPEDIRENIPTTPGGGSGGVPSGIRGR